MNKGAATLAPLLSGNENLNVAKSGWQWRSGGGRCRTCKTGSKSTRYGVRGDNGAAAGDGVTADRSYLRISKRKNTDREHGYAQKTTFNRHHEMW